MNKWIYYNTSRSWVAKKSWMSLGRKGVFKWKLRTTFTARWCYSQCPSIPDPQTIIEALLATKMISIVRGVKYGCVFVAKSNIYATKKYIYSTNIYNMLCNKNVYMQEQNIYMQQKYIYARTKYFENSCDPQNLIPAKF